MKTTAGLAVAALCVLPTATVVAFHQPAPAPYFSSSASGPSTTTMRMMAAPENDVSRGGFLSTWWRQCGLDGRLVC